MLEPNLCQSNSITSLLRRYNRRLCVGLEARCCTGKLIRELRRGLSFLNHRNSDMPVSRQRYNAVSYFTFL
jgi:hypothetical protein